jgi:hypothetical protein
LETCDHDGPCAHVVTCARYALGEHRERIGIGQIRAVDAPRAKHVALDHERLPPLGERRRLGLQQRVHIRTQALDVDVQLILAAHQRRVDGEPHLFAPQRIPDDALEPVTRLPCRGEEIRRAGAQQRGILDARLAAGGDQQEVRAAFAIREHRELRHHHACTGGGVVLRAPVRQTLILHDVLQGIPVGGVRQRRAQHRRDGRRCEHDARPRVRARAASAAGDAVASLPWHVEQLHGGRAAAAHVPGTRGPARNENRKIRPRVDSRASRCARVGFLIFCRR